MLVSFTCPICKMTSRNPNDVAAGYCGNCHDWTGDDLDNHIAERITDPAFRAAYEQALTQNREV